MRHPTSVYFRWTSEQCRVLVPRVRSKLSRTIARHSKSSKKTRKSKTSIPRPLIEVEDLINSFDALGIAKGDKLIVHSGVSNIGKLKGGLQPLYAHLRERVGPEGTLLFPAFTFDSLMKTYLDGSPEFSSNDSATTMGALSQIALNDPERIRSIHPTHSVIGFGKDLDYFLGSHHNDPTPFGPSSPFSRLSEQHGKILTIGVGLNSTTSFHVAEDRLGDSFPIKVYLDKSYSLSCKDANNRSLTVTTRCHDPYLSRIRDGDLMKQALLEREYLKVFPLGNNAVSVLDSNALDALLVEMATQHQKTVYGRVWG